jgi:solute carrier family 25 S-adenosylmethionine transporter 26
MQASSATNKPKVVKIAPKGGSNAVKLERGLTEVRGLYKGVIGAATGAGIIIGTYFAFYSTTKRFLREKTDLHEGASAFVAGATAALGSSVVKVPLAVCIRSVQAGVYKNVFHAGKSIVNAAGVRGLFTGFLPTVLEDVPDMAVKFAVYESLRKLHISMRDGRPANIAEDLIMGGVAGAAAAAATTPLDVVKTVMMCTASSRPTLISAAKSIMREGKGMKPFFRGVGPRALSNGLNSAIFFCFFEAIRQVLIKKQDAAAALALAEGIHPSKQRGLKKQELRVIPKVQRSGEELSSSEQQQQRGAAALRPVGTAAACLSLALPVDNTWQSNSE